MIKQTLSSMLLLSLAVTACAHGMTVFVDATDGDDLWNGLSPLYIQADLGPVRTLARAFELAQSVGDTIVAADGTYFAPPEMGSMMDARGITLKSANGPEECFLDASYGNRYIWFSSNEPEHPPVLEGFTVVNGVLAFRESSTARLVNCFMTAPPFLDGPIIHCKGNSSPEIRGCTFEGFQYLGSGVIFCGEQSSPGIIDCLFANNDVGSMGSVIFCAGFSTPVIESCTITDTVGHANHNSTAAAILCREWSHAVIKNCTIARTSPGYGGAIYADQVPSIEIRDCTITETSAQVGGGIVIYRCDAAEISGCTLTENTAGRGGAILIRGSDEASITACSVTNNSCEGGGGVYIWGSSNVFVSSCIINANDFEDYGGGVWAEGSGEITLFRCLVTGNHSAGHGGAVWLGSYCHINQCTIADNSASNGPTLRMGYGSILTNSIVWNNQPFSLDTHAPEIIGASYGNIGDLDFELPASWIAVTNADPLFAGDGDYHLKSQAGRYDPVAGDWVYDEVTSPCIDAGDPAEPFGDEPLGSGGRVNLGFYGGTEHASRTDICSGPLAGDTNKDCKVNFTDLAALAANWLTTTIVINQPPQE